MPQADDRAQHPQDGITERERGVPVESAKRLGGSTPRVCARDDAHFVDDAKPSGQVRDGSACVREDVLDVRRAGETVAVEHLRDRARRIRGEINKRVRQSEAVRHGIGRGVGVHKHGCPSSIEFCEYGLEACIAKVNPLDVRKQQHAIEFEHIEGVAQFVQRAVDVG